MYLSLVFYIKVEFVSNGAFCYPAGVLEEEGGEREEGDGSSGTGAPPSVFADTVP